MKTASALLGYRLHPFIALSYGTAANSVLHLPAAHPLPIKVKKGFTPGPSGPVLFNTQASLSFPTLPLTVVEGIHGKNPPGQQGTDDFNIMTTNSCNNILLD